MQLRHNAHCLARHKPSTMIGPKLHAITCCSALSSSTPEEHPLNAPVRHNSGLRDIAALLDDRPEEQIFQVDRRVFTDPDVYEAEVRYVFEGTWNFVGLETQIAEPDAFITTYIGRHPILLTRSKDGKINCLLNTCRHRG